PSALLSAGTYELLIDGSGAWFGDYAFRLIDLAADATTLAGHGEETETLLNPGNETKVYRFEASAGETFTFDDRLDGGRAWVRIIDPFGRDVSNALGFDDRTFSTELAGGHFLLIEGRVSDTVTERAYRFALDRPVDPAPAALTLGATTT